MGSRPLKRELVMTISRAIMELTEFLIAFSTTILILTLVSERFGNFFKLFLQDRRVLIPFIRSVNISKVASGKVRLGKEAPWYHLVSLSLKLDIMAVPQLDRRDEKLREYRILFANVIIGTLVATLINADLFGIIEQILKVEADKKIESEIILKSWSLAYQAEVLWTGAIAQLIVVWTLMVLMFNIQYTEKDKPKNLTVLAFFWGALALVLLNLVVNYWDWDQKGVEMGNVLKRILGYWATGFLLSLGSKFWHDLLDLFLRLKNTRQTLADPNTFSGGYSPEEIAKRAGILRSRVARELFEKYRGEISKIEGIASYGLNHLLDSRTKGLELMIEVEYTTGTAREKLEALKYEGQTEVEGMAFDLKDYMELKPTQPIRPLCNPSAETLQKIKHGSPVFFAHPKDHPNCLGSFGVKFDGERYYAISNLHVMVSERDLADYYSNKESPLGKSVQLEIKGHSSYTGVIDDFRFSNENNRGWDYARVEISKEFYDAFKLLEGRYIIQPNSSGKICVFGARSKMGVHKGIFETAITNIDYGPFEKQLTLYKIKCAPGNPLGPGDSGGVVYFKQSAGGYIRKGLVVSKGDNYAYFSMID